MTFETTSAGPADSYERLIRVEERLKHMDATQGQALRELRNMFTEFAANDRSDKAETRKRLDALEIAQRAAATKEEVQIERDRTNRIYWTWSAVVFIGTPVMMLIWKFVAMKVGL